MAQVPLPRSLQSKTQRMEPSEREVEARGGGYKGEEYANESVQSHGWLQSAVGISKKVRLEVSFEEERGG